MGKVLTREIVMMVGLGMETVPSMFAPSGSGVSLMEKFVTAKPVSLFNAFSWALVSKFQIRSW